MPAVITAGKENFIRSLNTLTGTLNKPKVSNRFDRSTTAKKLFKFKSKTKRRAIRYGILGANFVLLTAVVVFVLDVKHNEAKGTTATQNQSIFESSEAKPLDSISSADVAVNVARLTGLHESVAVVNKADTVRAEMAIASSDTNVTIKPQIIGAGLKSSKDIITYTVASGDTVTSLAEKFGITQDTIRASNDIAGEALERGKKLIISPVSGIVYKVKAGDTPESLASKYHANKQDLIIFNDIEATNKFKVGQLIVIPDGVEPSVPVVSTQTYSSTPTPSYSSSFAFGTSAIYSANGYDFGWCTWHAANRRREVGRPIPSNLGNAISWLYVAQGAGLPTGGTPRAGAVLYHKNIGGLGHVAFVEKVNSDGSMLVSDMNYPVWGKVTYRTVGSSEFGNYSFIY